MNSLYMFYLLIMITAALVSVSIAVRVWSSRKINLDASSLILVLSAITLWIIAALLGLLDQDLNHKLLWAKVEYIGVTSVPLALLGYVLNHFGYHKIITRKRIIWFAIIPAATLILAWTNEYHHLIWIEYIPYLDGGLVFSNKVYGAGFWLYWVYSYILLTIATVLTLRLTLRSSKIFRWQSLMILIAILTPWVGNVLYVLHINPFGELDLTPLAFAITCISLAIGMFRWDLSNFRPVAQEAAIAGMTDGLLFLDDQGRILDMNPAAQKILGIDIQSSIGKQIDDIFSELLPSYERIDNLGEKSVELKIKSGKESRNFEISDLPFSEKSDNPNGKIVLLHDTTHLKTLEIKLKEMERKHTKALLQQAENKFAVLYRNMPWGVMYWDTDGKVVEMNPAAETILKANIEQINEMLNKPEEYQMIQEDGSELSPDHFSKILSDSLREQVNNKVIGFFDPEEKDFRWVIFSFIPLFRPNEDNPYQIFSTLGDITEPKRAEMRLRESQNTLQEIVNAVSESILLIDLKGNLITVNETTTKRLGKPKSELIGKNVIDFIPGDMANVFKKWFEVAVQEKKPLQFEDEQFGAWIENNLYPIIDEDGVVHQIVVYGRDITNRKRAENAIKASMQEAQQRAKTINVVNQIGNKITSGLEFDQLMFALYEESKKLWEIDQFYVSLYDDETEMISFPFSYLNGEPHPIASRKNHTIIGLTEYILDNLETLYIPDTYLLPEKGKSAKK